MLQNYVAVKDVELIAIETNGKPINCRSGWQLPIHIEAGCYGNAVALHLWLYVLHSIRTNGPQRKTSIRALVESIKWASGC